jgi:hypothetical protein
MEDLEDGAIAHQFQHRREVDSVRQSVDGGEFFLARKLNEAKFRPVGSVANEFGVDSDEVGLANALAKRSQRTGVGDHGHGGAI